MGTKHGRVAEVLCPQLSAAERLAHTGHFLHVCSMDKRSRRERSSLCGGDRQVTVKKSCSEKTAWTVLCVFSDALVLCTESLPELGASLRQPICVPALCAVPGGHFSRREELPGGHRSVRTAFVSGLGGLGQNQVTRSRKMSLLTSLGCTEVGVGCQRLGGSEQVSQEK